MTIISPQNILTASAILCVLVSVIIFASIYYNPRLWLQDYPKAIQAKVPPLTADEKKAQLYVFVPFLLAMLGTPILATLLLRQAQGGSISFLSAYLNVFFILQIANLFDALVVDLLVGTFIRPSFAAIPGAEGMDDVFRDWGWHLRNYLKGILICSVLSLPLALVALL